MKKRCPLLMNKSMGRHNKNHRIAYHRFLQLKNNEKHLRRLLNDIILIFSRLFPINNICL